MSLEAIRDKIKNTLVNSVPGIGIVHDYERYAVNFQDYLNYFKKEDKINGWTITRDSTTEKYKDTSSNLRTYHFTIRGRYSLQDKVCSEKSFQTLLENISNVFRKMVNLEGVAAHQEPIQIEEIGYAMYGDVLCHFARLTLEVSEDEVR